MKILNIIKRIGQCFTIVLPLSIMTEVETLVFIGIPPVFHRNPKRITLVKRRECLKMRGPPLFKGLLEAFVEY